MQDGNKKDILLEGKLEKETTILSRAFINALKKNNHFLQKYHFFHWNKAFLAALGVSFSGLDALSIIYDRGLDYKNKSLYTQAGISGSYAPGRKIIKLDVNIPADWTEDDFKDNWFEIISEFKKALRHELEHSSQNINRLRASVKYQTDRGADFKTYHRSAIEMEAFVSGLYKMAKMQKISLKLVFDKFFAKVRNRYARDLGERYSFSNLNVPGSGEKLVDLDVQKTRKKWEAYARKRFPAAQL